jgi:hypothetical protein
MVKHALSLNPPFFAERLRWHSCAALDRTGSEEAGAVLQSITLPRWDAARVRDAEQMAHDRSGYSHVTISTVAIDDVIAASSETVRLLHVNAEESTAAVLRGAARAISERRVSHIIAHVTRFREGREVIGQLGPVGYCCLKYVERWGYMYEEFDVTAGAQLNASRFEALSDHDKGWEAEACDPVATGEQQQQQQKQQQSPGPAVLWFWLPSDGPPCVPLIQQHPIEVFYQRGNIPRTQDAMYWLTEEFAMEQVHHECDPANEDPSTASSTSQQLSQRKVIGQWLQSPAFCSGFFSPFCSPASWTWLDHVEVIAPAAACSLLQRFSSSSKITKVLFVGDSNVRHAYQAFAMSLSGDYERGGVSANAPLRCTGNSQFEQALCRREVPSFDSCAGSVKLELEWRQNDHWYMLNPEVHSRSRADVIVWYTVPPHSPALGGDISHGRARKHYGNCSASALESVVLSRVCTPEALQRFPPVLVLSPHLPLHDTDPSTLEAYSRRAAQMVREKCGFEAVDVYTLTSALVRTLPREEANALTHDGGHWSRAVSLWKAQMLLRALRGMFPGHENDGSEL